MGEQLKKVSPSQMVTTLFLIVYLGSFLGLNFIEVPRHLSTTYLAILSLLPVVKWPRLGTLVKLPWEGKNLGLYAFLAASGILLGIVALFSWIEVLVTALFFSA